MQRCFEHGVLLVAVADDALKVHSLNVQRRIRELPGAESRLSVRLWRWDFSDMERLRSHVRAADQHFPLKTAEESVAL